MTALILLLGAGMGAGTCLVAWGLSWTDNPKVRPKLAELYPDLGLRAVLAAAAGAVVLAITR